MINDTAFLHSVTYLSHDIFFLLIIAGMCFLLKELSFNKLETAAFVALTVSSPVLHRSLGMIRPENFMLVAFLWLYDKLVISMRKKLFQVAFLSSFISLLAVKAFASDAFQYTYIEFWFNPADWQKSDVIFLGKALEDLETFYHNPEDYSLKFQVEKQFKGSLEKVAEVWIDMSCRSCFKGAPGPKFVKDKTYLIRANFHHKDGQLHHNGVYSEDQVAESAVDVLNNLERISKFQGGGEFKTYYKNGQVFTQGQWAGGKLHGGFQIYSEDGKLYHTEPYVNGVVHGTKKTYLPSGEVSEIEFRNGKASGRAFYNSDGTVRFIDNFKTEAGKIREDKSYKYFADGSVKQETTTTHRSLGEEGMNTTKEYDTTGQLIRKTTYRDFRSENGFGKEYKIYDEKERLEEEIYFDGAIEHKKKYDETGRLTYERKRDVKLNKVLYEKSYIDNK